MQIPEFDYSRTEEKEIREEYRLKILEWVKTLPEINKHSDKEYKMLLNELK